MIATRASLLCAAASLAAPFLTGCQRSEASRGDLAQLERGRYLVENVGMCADCHTPRGPGGVFDRSKWLQGAPIEFAPKHPMPFATAAPPIAGMPGYGREAAVVFLSEGRAPHGRPLLPPMPPYRFTKADAEAVYSYLVSLAPKAGK